MKKHNGSKLERAKSQRITQRKLWAQKRKEIGIWGKPFAKSQTKKITI